ncbi:MAG: NADH-quinone oxidoreductase subunit NuoE [Rhodobacteraceae bacterium]|nr:MAG: NADH-quinone oxidoreductase subunit NuoE [Paracoccaceae bacterium]
MLRRLHSEQPDSFAFTAANQAWAEAQLTKFPEGRQASGVIPLLWRAQEQEGWLSKPAIESIADMLGMAYIRVLEVATFYFMFQLKPVGSVAHIQICGTTSCMLCGSEDLIGICQEVIAKNAHEISADGKFSWEEVECLGACTNAPMAQIGKDYYEDLTAEKFRDLLKAFENGEVPTPGPQNGRFAAEPLGGLTSLKDKTGEAANGSVALANALGDTIKRIQGDEVPIITKPKPKTKTAAAAGQGPTMLDGPREGGGDDLKKIKGVGPKLEADLNDKGVWHYDQIAAWTEAEVKWADDNLVKFKGRVSRDDWVGQAKLLAEGGDTAFSKKVDKGDVY